MEDQLCQPIGVVFNIIDAIQSKNNLSKAVTITSYNTIATVFQKGYQSLVAMLTEISKLNQSNATITTTNTTTTTTVSNVNTSAVISNLFKSFFLNTYTMLSEQGRSRSRTYATVSKSIGNITNATNTTNPVYEMYDTILANRTAELEVGLKHAEFILGSIIYYDELIKAIVRILEQVSLLIVDVFIYNI